MTQDTAKATIARTCEQCGVGYLAQRERSRFCSKSCKNKKYVADGRRRPSVTVCSVSECERTLDAGGYGLCNMHYRRWRRNGDPNARQQADRNWNNEQRLRSRGWTVVDRVGYVDGPCWEWNGNINPQGYGTVRTRGKTMGAHRVAYETWVGPIPDGMFACHRCDNPPCMNPAHIFPGTPQDNVTDMWDKGRAPTYDWDGPKLTRRDAEEIRRLRAAGISRMKVAAQYGLTLSYVSEITGGKVWVDRTPD